jgi:beta-lactamase regulating signal transducer with metallopeptidase domain
MSIGASLFLIAAGAILRYAITWNPKDVNIETVGLILMIVGIVGLLLSLLWMFIYADRRRETTAPPPAPRDRDVY